MLELNSEPREIYLDPGELHIAREPLIIRTALGACIGTTFWSAKLGVGALCHPLWPSCPTDLTAEKRLVAGRRYVDFSIRQLAWQFEQLDVSRGEVQVKVFRGAEVLRIGAAAKSVIASHQGLGGKLGRQIQFHTGTGEVAMRWLGKTRAEDVIAE